MKNIDVGKMAAFGTFLCGLAFVFVGAANIFSIRTFEGICDIITGICLMTTGFVNVYAIYEREELIEEINIDKTNCRNLSAVYERTLAELRELQERHINEIETNPSNSPSNAPENSSKTPPPESTKPTKKISSAIDGLEVSD